MSDNRSRHDRLAVRLSLIISRLMTGESLSLKTLSDEFGVTERTLRTVGDKWSYLQRVKFGANAQPFYVLLDNQGKPLNKSYAYNEDIPKYIEFLQTGLENYKKGK